MYLSSEQLQWISKARDARCLSFSEQNIELLTINDIEKILSLPDLDYPVLKFSSDENLIDLEMLSDQVTVKNGCSFRFLNTTKVESAFQNGAQLILSNVELVSPKAKLISREIGQFLNSYIEISIMICNSMGQKFSTHYDDHDILSFQILGNKKWTWFKPSSCLSKVGDNKIHPLPYRLDEKKLDINRHRVVKENDLFFMPSYVPHKVVACGPSVHMNLAIYPASESTINEGFNLKGLTASI